MILTHYIIVRRDLTVGDLVAQVAHAAGAIRETDGPHAAHLTAVGLVPAPKAAVAHRLNEFHMPRECASQGSLQ